jgi:adenosylcobinamide-GDP ribazoletransferase
MLNDFLTAVQFLTTAPPLIRRPFTPGEMGRSVAYYPLVGALLGLVLFGADTLLAIAVPAMLRVALLLVLWVLLTGALHLDGFLDSCDGLLGGYTPEKRMEIMRDHRVGAYALAGGILLFLVKFSALVSLQSSFAALLLAPALGRWGIAVAVAAFPYARPKGLGRDMKDHTTWRQAAVATVFALAFTLIAGWKGGGWSSLLALAGAALTLASATRFILKRIPGLTGDSYGAINELIETVVLILFVIGLRLP